MANGKWLQCRRSRTHTHTRTHTQQGSRLAAGVGVAVGTVAAEQSCVKSSALMSGQIKCYTRRRIAATRLVVATCCPALHCTVLRTEMLTLVSWLATADFWLPAADCWLPTSDSPLDICLKLRFMSCHERNWKFPCFFFSTTTAATSHVYKQTHTHTSCIPCSLDWNACRLLTQTVNYVRLCVG